MTKTRTKKPSSTHYEGDVFGREFKLPRVTSVIAKVTGDAKGGMSYWGAQLAIKWAVAAKYAAVVSPLDDDGRPLEEVYDEWYADFKKSPFDPNKTKTARGKEGTQAHKLFERLLTGDAEIDREDHDGTLWVVIPGDPAAFIPKSYDLAVTRAYVDIFQHLDDGELESETKVRWFEPGHPEGCDDDICTHGFAGTSDFIMPALGVGGDLKTHKGDARFTDFLQNGFYSVARKQMDGTEIDHHMVLLAREDGTYDEAHGYVGEDAVMATYALYKVIEGGWLH